MRSLTMAWGLLPVYLVPAPSNSITSIHTAMLAFIWCYLGSRGWMTVLVLAKSAADRLTGLSLSSPNDAYYIHRSANHIQPLLKATASSKSLTNRFNGVNRKNFLWNMEHLLPCPLPCLLSPFWSWQKGFRAETTKTIFWVKKSPGLSPWGLIDYLIRTLKTLSEIIGPAFRPF